MSKAFILTLLALCLSVCQTPIVQADTIRLISFPIPLMVESDNKGVFIDLVKEIDRRIEHTIEVIVLPTKRALHVFHNGQADGLFPATDLMLNTAVYKSSSIYIKEDYGFVKHGLEPPESISDLRNMTIGLTLGYPYANEITALNTSEFEFAGTDEMNIQKLLAERIDVFIVEELSGLKAIQNSNATEYISYNSDKPLSQQDVYFAFQKTANAKEYADDFSKALQSMKTDGTFEKIVSLGN